jgi:DnaD/phage-associated family protein
MQYLDFKSLLYSDTLVPDIFISEYLPALKSEYVKIYIYCLFLAGKNKSPTVQELAHVIDLPAETVKKGLAFMSNLELMSWSNEGVILADLKEKEIGRFYRPKSTSLPEDAAARGRLDAKRRQLIMAINDTFFSGAMSPTWYIDIDMWFERYGFEEDVMLLLFQHCRDNNGLAKPYIAKVAESWHAKGIRNSFEVDRHLREYAAAKGAAKQIQKKLKLRKPLDEYQEELVDKWVNKFGFSMEIIELALKRSLYATNAGFAYYDKILSDWSQRGLATVEQITEAGKSRQAGAGADGSAANAGRQAVRRGGRARDYAQADYDQREYDGSEYDKFVSYGFGGVSNHEGAAPAGAETGDGEGNGNGEGDGAEPGIGFGAGAGLGQGAGFAAAEREAELAAALPVDGGRGGA